jgi:DNA phosphorothioation-dependent restriction protein DptH
MSIISKIIGELLEDYFRTSTSEDRDCRLIVPGLTNSIAKEIHEYLCIKKINSYLVINEDFSPDKEKRWIKPIGLTSKRIGSFIAVAYPGQLAHIHDSIRGSGGAIRSIAFSEEWPWIDNGTEAFRFNGTVLKRLVESWTSDKDKQSWLKEFVTEGLVKYTRTLPNRAQLLLEKILGTFSIQLYPEINDIRGKILFHAGVPRPFQDIPNATNLIRSTVKLCKKIIERCRKEDDIREQTKEMVSEFVSDEVEIHKIEDSIDVFLDGLGSNMAINYGLLSFYACWGTDGTETIHWKRLNHTRLKELFSIKDPPEIDFTCIIGCERGIISSDGNSVATFIGEKVYFEVLYGIPPEEFSTGTWEIRLLKRNKELSQQILGEHKGSMNFQLDISESNIQRYFRKVTLGIAIFIGEEKREEIKLSLQLCGEERPSLIVIEPGFEIVEPTKCDPDESPDKKIETDEAVQLYFLDNNGEKIVVKDEDDKEEHVIEINKKGKQKISKLANRIEPSIEVSGQANRICMFGGKSAHLCFEASDQEKGEFTLEDEFRVQLAGVRYNKRLKEIERIFRGENRDPYLNLGNLNNASRRCIRFAVQMTDSCGWKPLLANLLDPVNEKPGTVGDYINIIGEIKESGFKEISFPDEILNLLKAYSESRDNLLNKITENVDPKNIKLEHPLYATHPIFVDKRSKEIEELLVTYLKNYMDMLLFLGENYHKLDWAQIFVLTYLDCVVHWDNGALKNSIFLIGPWHPMVIAKRFMIQSALFARSGRLLNEKDENGKEFRHLAVMLEKIQGFYWSIGLSGDDRVLEPIHVIATSDPGWHFAFKINVGSLVAKDEVGSLTGISDRLRAIFGLDSNIAPGDSDDLAISCFSSYLRAYPSRRSLGVRIKDGYNWTKILESTNWFLHDDVGPTNYGMQLPGGIRLYFEKSIGESENIQWSNPPIYAYKYKNDDECLNNENPDIYLISPIKDMAFTSGAKIKINREGIPRGKGLNAVFSEPLSRLTEGQSLVPKSVSSYDECDSVPGQLKSLGDTFTAIIKKMGNILGGFPTISRSVDLPQRLRCHWLIAPGGGLDPATFVKYVRDGSDRKIQDRVLWDYRIDIRNKHNSFYILSTIPRKFSVVVNGVFNRDDLAEDFIKELGRHGIAIGGEALKSGRHAQGVIGLVGTVRLLQGIGGNSIGPIKNDQCHVGFLVPVDSFSSFFGYDKFGNNSYSKRADLLAIQLVLPDESNNNLKILACGVESKYLSHTLGKLAARDAIGQAQETISKFRSLVRLSIKNNSIPERLALLALLRFGLRITSPSSQGEISEWVKIERIIFEAILQGQYEYVSANFETLLVSTELALTGPADIEELENGLWIRLNKMHWPGVVDTTRLDNIRKQLSLLFDDMHNQKERSKQEGDEDTDHEENFTAKKTSNIIKPTMDNYGKNMQTPRNESISPASSEVLPLGKRLTRIFIGSDDRRKPVYYDPKNPVNPLDNLNMMITGSSGTGKTQFLKYIISKLREQGINVLILDFKNDFASDDNFAERAHLDRVFVTFDGLPYNPLIPYPMKHPGSGELYIQCGQHVSGITSVLRRTYGLGPQQQIAVKNAIVEAFTSMNIPTTGTINYVDSISFPGFAVVGDTLQDSNPAAYNRLDPLFTLGLFRADFSDNSFHSLVGKSTILDLSQIPSDEIKNALAQLIVLSAHAYFNSQAHSGSIRQMLIFDEAHRVLNSDYILRLVRECRAYGVGTILSSQLPSDFKSEISASLDTKIIHSNGSNSERVKEIVQLIGCQGREADVSELERFQAFIDNSHNKSTFIRTMNYPLYLIVNYLREYGSANREELSKVRGLDTQKLPLGNLIHQLERLGLAEEREGQLHLLEYE